MSGQEGWEAGVYLGKGERKKENAAEALHLALLLETQALSRVRQSSEPGATGLCCLIPTAKFKNYLLCPRHSIKWSTCIIAFNPFNSPGSGHMGRELGASEPVEFGLRSWSVRWETGLFRYMDV